LSVGNDDDTGINSAHLTDLLLEVRPSYTFFFLL
jgi:hypothetical protein